MPKANLKITDSDTQAELQKKLGDIKLHHQEDEVIKKAQSLGWPYVNLVDFPISQETIKVVSRDKAETLQTVCFLYTGEELRLGSMNPDNPQVALFAKELGENYHTHVKIYYISERSFKKALEIYERIPVIEQFDGIKIDEQDLNKFSTNLKDLTMLSQMIQEINVTEVVTLIISAALKFEASDIHIEAEEKEVKVRFRLDGMLQEAATLTKDLWPKINARLKILSGLKLNIGNKPQDGRITIELKNEKVEVRVSTIPSAYGESIVMRLLRSSSIGLEFEQLGLRGKSFYDLNNEMGKPNGMIISTGPTGSGKTTTLYAILKKLNKADTKIITLEDPIEYKLDGIVQSQIDNVKDDGPTMLGDEVKQTKSYTFAKGLRAILRQDPDIVMVGEIRDLETADTAINAALTGHLMLSTLHTNSAAGAIPRFLAMGVKPFLLAPALNAIIGQRLVRKLCSNCKIEDKLDNKTLTIVMNALNELSPKSGARIENLSSLTFYTAKGCEQCNNLGYKGRVGIYEIFTMSPEIEKLILSGNVSEYTIQKLAIESGMITMLQDGILKALDGITSIAEVLDKARE